MVSQTAEPSSEPTAASQTAEPSSEPTASQTAEPSSAPTAQTTSETPVSTDTTEESLGCSTGEYVSVDSQTSDKWCQTNCEINEEKCLRTNLCVCSSDRRMEGSGVSALSVVALSMLV